MFIIKFIFYQIVFNTIQLTLHTCIEFEIKIINSRLKKYVVFYLNIQCFTDFVFFKFNVRLGGGGENVLFYWLNCAPSFQYHTGTKLFVWTDTPFDRGVVNIVISYIADYYNFLVQRVTKFIFSLPENHVWVKYVNRWSVTYHVF